MSTDTRTDTETKTKTKRTTEDVTFKKEAVQMVISSGRPLTQIAGELGVTEWKLRDWKERYQAELSPQPTTIQAMRVRLEQLERDNLQLRTQRDILKKTLGIISTT